MKENKDENLISRPPVVVVLGHIDSGKTTLLDQIRKSRVAEGESGGITQHIGAYQVEKGGRKITFIDTPGHEAFSQMRSRGAKIADVAILVVDSCKGVQTQTKEVIKHVQDAGISCVVALNKTDKPTAFPQKAEKELQKEGITVESLGGDVPSVKISAKTGKGIDDLLDLIILVSEMKDLKANAGEKAKGVIIESYLDNKRGPTATLLINEGTLEPGDIVGTSFTMGKIKILEDFQGTQLEKAMPGDPAVVLGFEDAPRIGESFREFPSLAEAQENVQPKERREISAPEQKPESDQKILNIILKTDVLGSIEAVEEILQTIPQEKVALNLLRAEVGNITQNDVKMAQSSKALILGFRVDINKAAERLLQREETSVEVMTFNIIYELVEGIKKTIEKGLEPEIVRTDVARLKVLKTFWSKKRRQIVGGRIIEGTVKKGLSIEVTREGEAIDQGKIIDLQKKKQPIRQASKGEEVGLLYEGEKKIEKDDVLVFFKKERKKATL